MLALAIGAMPETKTNKMMEREQANEEKEKQINETQISKSLNLKSKSKPISFQPIKKETEVAFRETKRERTCQLSRKMMDGEGHRSEREGYRREGTA